MKIKNVMSVDVEEWFHPEALRPFAPQTGWANQPSHVERQVDRILALYDECGVRATFFILGQVAESSPDLVKRIVREGHEIASHGYGHEMITQMDRASFRDDLVKAKTIIEDVSGCPVLGYRAPTFSVMNKTLWALDIIAETGHRYDASVYPILHDRYGIPSVFWFFYCHDNGLSELPGSTVRLVKGNFPVGGGGYLRLLPLAFNVAALEVINRLERQPFVVYLHPWETDPNQPRLELPFPRVLRHYGFIDRMLGKLRTLCERFEFTTAEDVLAARGLL